MLPSRVRLAPGASDLVAGFTRIRAQMGLHEGFPVEVESAARAAAAVAPTSVSHHDRSEIDFVTIDPPGSKDLDQAFHAERTEAGFRVHYAIADPGWFIQPGDALDLESWERGQTLYAPDGRVRLYPATLSEGAASLLAGQLRPAVLWEMDLDAAGAVRETGVARTLVRSREQLTYQQAQAEIDGGSPRASLALLATIGELRRQLERDRGGIHLELPEQEILELEGGYELAFRGPLAVEEWNAQISLMTGMAAAELMLAHGAGLLRTLPPPRDEALEGLQRSAASMGLQWEPQIPYADFLAGLDTRLPKHAAMANIAMRLFQGADYVAITGTSQEGTMQHAIGAPYAHVTAPLRRLADRYANEVVLFACRGEAPPAWVTEALPRLPQVMKESRRRAGELDRRVVDYVEAAVLEPRVGETFEGVVIEAGEKSGTVQLKDPAVVAHCSCPKLQLGADVRIRLVEADPARGRVDFAIV
jgi:exoribonuclease R